VAGGFPAQAEAGDPDPEERERRGFGNLSYLAPDLATSKLSGVEIDVGQAAQNIRQLSGQVRILPFERIPLSTNRPADLVRERCDDNVVGIVVVERRAYEAPDHTSVNATAQG